MTREPYFELTKTMDIETRQLNIRRWLDANYLRVDVTHTQCVAFDDLPHVEKMLLGFADAVIDGNQHGHFITSVLANDLQKSFGYADDVNIKYLWLYVRFVYNMLPSRRATGDAA